MKKTLERARREAEHYLGKLPLPGDMFFRAVGAMWQQRVARGQPMRGVLVEIYAPRTPLEKLSSRLRTTWLRARPRLAARLYERLPPLYAQCLLHPKPDDIYLNWDKLERCAEADRQQHKAVLQDAGAQHPDRFASPPDEFGSLEDDVRESWKQLVEACHDLYLFPLRSRLLQASICLKFRLTPRFTRPV